MGLGNRRRVCVVTTTGMLLRYTVTIDGNRRYLLVLQASEEVRLILAVPMHGPGARVLVQTRQLAIVRFGRVAAFSRRVQPLYLGICGANGNSYCGDLSQDVQNALRFGG